MLDLSESIEQLFVANKICWYVHILRREDGHVLRRDKILRLKVRRRSREA